jgi:hypothetical protein
MKAQGYGVKDNVLFQDNKSSILWRRMGKLRTASARSILTSGISVNPSGKAGAQISQLPPGDNSSPRGDKAIFT